MPGFDYGNARVRAMRSRLLSRREMELLAEAGTLKGFIAGLTNMTPTKMINAAAFGVPSVAVWRSGYEEFEGNYIPVRTMDELVENVSKLKDKETYQKSATKAFETAQKYHISKIIKLYKRLEELG